MKHIFFSILLFCFGSHLSVNGQNKSLSNTFLQRHFKHLEPIIYTNAISIGLEKEFLSIFNHDTLRNNQSEAMLILTKVEKERIYNEIGKLNQRFVDKDLLKKSCFLPKEKLDLILKDQVGGWADFYKKYGKGYYSFSKPIFIRDNSICIFFFNYTCGVLCAKGELTVYKKSGKKWVKWFILNDYIS
ncbi:hypothetical protein D3C87_890530 [compost metagenome]|uniref:hypothetical protein n=1 Tax=Pedobacter ghigonis TaxID=2730403 RepID=UPI000FBAE33B|nr:hypothetical protein [Pedobacter ghigonis]